MNGSVWRLAFALWPLSLWPVSLNATIADDKLLVLAQQVCSQADNPALEIDGETATLSPIEVRNTRIGQQLDWRVGGEQLRVELLRVPARPPQTVLTHSNHRGPQVRVVLDQNCRLAQARRRLYSELGQAIQIEHLDARLQPTGQRDWLNPALPAAPAERATGPRVGMLDSGVNYLLPHIAARLARRADGSPIGYDFWDMDAQPYDAHPVRSAFQVQRHGTRTASILLREAPDIQLVPYRYPRPDMSRMTQLVEHASANQVRVIGMPLGGNRYADWAEFSDAAEAHPEILFIASAGNNGRDIDVSPVYPAALEIDNLLVVTSASDFVEPASRTNYGRIAVDYLLPAEAIETIDYDGSAVAVSGSSYAVPRLVALAARLLTQNPELSVRDLKRRIGVYSVRARTGRYVARGYIPDPLADRAKVELTARRQYRSGISTAHELSLRVAVLTEHWLATDVETTLATALQLLAQCDIATAQIELSEYQVSPWLRDLATGTAHTVLTRMRENDQTIAIVFANDTQMHEAYDAEAFGAGNTGNRPWLRNSVWLTRATADPGIALAHELFHVIVNSGEHSDRRGNLMQRRTRPGETDLTAYQCENARASGLARSLFRATD